MQAGTGTGKSLAYLVPGIRHALETGRTVVVSTATIALQRQLVERDLPRLANALGPLLGEEPEFAILKGRNNYLCLNKIRSGSADDPAEPELFDAFATRGSGRDVQRLHKWAEQTKTGDRDEVVPGVRRPGLAPASASPRASASVRRGARTACDCFAENRPHQRSAHADVVVTNHALLAIDAITGIVGAARARRGDRRRGPRTGRPGDRCRHGGAVACGDHRRRLAAPGTRPRGRTRPAWAAAADALERLLDELNPGRWDAFPSGADASPALWRCRMAVRTAVEPTRSGPSDPAASAARAAALAALDEVHDAAARTLRAFDEPDPAARRGCGVARGEQRQAHDPDRTAVGGALLRTQLFETATVILTSATLQLGGSFDALARTWGLPGHEREPRD